MTIFISLIGMYLMGLIIGMVSVHLGLEWQHHLLIGSISGVIVGMIATKLS